MRLASARLASLPAALARHGATEQLGLPAAASALHLRLRLRLAMMCVGMRQVCHASSVCGCCKCLSVRPPCSSLSLPISLALCLSPFAAGSFRFRALSQCSARASAAVAGLIFDYVISPSSSSKAPCRGIVRPIVVPHSTVARCQGATVFTQSKRERDSE